MTGLAVLLSVVAACAFAFGSVLQQKGALQTEATQQDPRFLVQILHRPAWLAGAGLQLAGWILQAAAFDRGSLIGVQAISSLNLVLVLPLGTWLTDQVVTGPVWIGACCVLAGVVLFLATGSPQGGASTPSAADWWSSGALCLLAVALLSGLARRHSDAPAAFLFGAAAGTCLAFQGAVTKELVPLVGKGLAAVLSSWTIYVLITTAAIGFVMMQSALKTGVLAPATAASNALTLFGSVVFGMTVFGEKLSAGAGRLAPALIGLVVAGVGMWLLATDHPPGGPSGPATESERPSQSLQGY